MKDLFNEVLGIDGVKGALLFNDQGMIVYRDANVGDGFDPASTAWWLSFVNTLNGIQELELTFSAGRVYVRRTPSGYLMVWMAVATPMAMIRLNCDILLHGLKQAAPNRSFRGFFRRRV